MPRQIVLDVNLPDEQTFDTFIVGDNDLLVEQCRQLVSPSENDGTPFLTFLAGAEGAGKSHLLVALCHLAAQQNISHFYLSLEPDMPFPAQILDDLEKIQLVCIDNIQHLSHQLDWQEALFDLINRSQETQGCKLVISANQGPKNLEFQLADLISRLTWGISFTIQPLDDDLIEKALVLKAKSRGIIIAPESIRYLISHTRRDLHSLTQTLETLELKSLQEKRKLSIPFIKQALDI
ncbi:DnaA regulatory inactivator Hda [Aliiglaciecola sp. LCG003]|uniref:DnaA regulatory inactivator Hda n=1 Tax=Aliiglaciecola sp. LCG003 TaxID=3053655 RepID=UPI0025727DE7|nr:DnaA regulatory inactivator Hda [Aliiglaciecola sp. LCG003]WJG11141.1 DnaA regulatory inactivator Hda [Aliiglaciecola sp. LCG003]